MPGLGPACLRCDAGGGLRISCRDAGAGLPCRDRGPDPAPGRAFARGV